MDSPNQRRRDWNNFPEKILPGPNDPRRKTVFCLRQSAQPTAWRCTKLKNNIGPLPPHFRKGRECLIVPIISGTDHEKGSKRSCGVSVHRHRQSRLYLLAQEIWDCFFQPMPGKIPAFLESVLWQWGEMWVVP